MHRHDGSPRPIANARPRLAIALLAVSLATPLPWAPAHAASTSIPPVTQPLAGPQATLERLADGYRDISPEAVIATLTADYRFHSFGDSLAGFMSGRSRAAEAGLVQALLRGGGMPRADSLGMRMDGIREGIDPEHPDSTQHYRILTVNRFEMGIRDVTGNRFVTLSREHIFHVVRGDVALLVDGQAANPERWYIRRWIENVTGIRDLLAGQDGRCGEPGPPSAGPRSQAGGSITALAIRPLTNPACAKLDVTCALPGAEPASVEVFDVSGRLVNRRQVRVTGTGEVSVEAGRGARILPGVYWVRLSQATRRPSTRMVVVAR